MRLLKQLTEAQGAPCQEQTVREMIQKELEGYPVEITQDCNGNLLVHRPPSSGRKDALRVVMDAHMDEPSFIVTKIYPDGLVGFFDHGGPDENCVANENVRIGKERVPGLIIKPVPESINHEEFRIDIGAQSAEEAGQYVQVGDPISFYSEADELENGWMISKAFDDRDGCYTMVELLKNDYDVDLYGAFTVQEELGIRGPKSLKYLKPDINLNFEATGTAEIPGIPENLYNASVGSGPVVFIQDFTLMLHDSLRRYIAQCAEEEGIPFQFRGMCVGGSNAGTWYSDGDGVAAGVIALPHYNCHGPSSMACLADVKNTIALGDAVLRRLSEDGHSWKQKIQERRAEKK